MEKVREHRYLKCLESLVNIYIGAIHLLAANHILSIASLESLYLS